MKKPNTSVLILGYGSKTPQGNGGNEGKHHFAADAEKRILENEVLTKEKSPVKIEALDSAAG